mmetsp:Transcript_59081/g.155595  ORF Transcript_59081/g.155595 Transcript_59081/m.155595 type:complete len:229 (+) Transcript_59081:456-1142(+)
MRPLWRHGQGLLALAVALEAHRPFPHVLPLLLAIEPHLLDLLQLLLQLLLGHPVVRLLLLGVVPVLLVLVGVVPHGLALLLHLLDARPLRRLQQLPLLPPRLLQGPLGGLRRLLSGHLRSLELRDLALAGHLQLEYLHPLPILDHRGLRLLGVPLLLGPRRLHGSELLEHDRLGVRGLLHLDGRILHVLLGLRHFLLAILLRALGRRDAPLALRDLRLRLREDLVDVA